MKRPLTAWPNLYAEGRLLKLLHLAEQDVPAWSHKLHLLSGKCSTKISVAFPGENPNAAESRYRGWLNHALWPVHGKLESSFWLILPLSLFSDLSAPAEIIFIDPMRPPVFFLLTITKAIREQWWVMGVWIRGRWIATTLPTLDEGFPSRIRSRSPHTIFALYFVFVSESLLRHWHTFEKWIVNYTAVILVR